VVLSGYPASPIHEKPRESHILESVTDYFRNERPEGVQPGFLRPIDTEAIARQLDLDDRARERGASNLPAGEDDVLDTVEQTVTQKIESEWSWQGDALISELRAYASRLVQFSIKSEFERLQLLGRDALARLRAGSHRAEADLGPLKESYIAAREELSRFRGRHRLTRPPRAASHRWTTIGLMVFLIGIESILNGFFFASGSEFGLVGGIGTAIGISLVNVLFAFAIGLIPTRWMFHRNVLLKATGLFVTLGGLAAILTLQAFAAQYREATALVGDDRALFVAIERLRGPSPWEVSSMASIYLFALGLVFAAAAYWKGFTFDDPYPAYGRVARRAIEVREEYSDAHADLFDQLETIKEDTVTALADGIDRLPRFPQSAADIRHRQSALVQKFRGYESSVESAANQLLQRYRDENRKHRTSAAPPHFNSRWSLPHRFVDAPEVSLLITAPLETAGDVQGPLRELRALSHEVLAEYEAMLTHYPHPTEMRQGGNG
jgi:hypothetical protein